MASRFVFPGQYAMRVTKDANSKVLAYFDVVDTQTGLMYRDMKIINGPTGTFVSSASKSYETKQKETKFSNYVGAAYDTETDGWNEAGLAWFDELHEAAYAKYQEMGGGAEPTSSAPKSKSAPSRTAPATRSARGPVNPPRARPKDDKVPF